MSKATLNFWFTNESNTAIESIEAVPLNGLLWKIFGAHSTDGWQLHLECTPINKTLLFECDVFVKFQKRLIGPKMVHLKRDLGLDPTVSSQIFNAGALFFDENMHMDIEIMSLFENYTFDIKKVTDDIQLIVGDKTFYTDKQLLSQHSRYFREMVRNTSPRWETSTILIRNVDPCTFNKYLNVLHGYEVPTFPSQKIPTFTNLALAFDSERSLKFAKTLYSGPDYHDTNYTNLIRRIGCKEKIKEVESCTFDFKETNLTDITVIVGDKKFHTIKKILGQQSTKFYEMIYEAGEVDEIVIDQVDSKLFYKFILVLHGFPIQTLEKNELKPFLDLAIQYDAERCLDYFRKSKEGLSSGLTQISIDTEKTVFIHGIPFNINPTDSEFTVQVPIADLNWECAITIKYMDTVYSGNFQTENYSQKFCIPESQGTPKISVDVLYYQKSAQEIIDFCVSRDNITDIVLSVGDKKYHVSKQILASVSTYFNSMFYSNFNEKDRADIPLIGIDKDDFEEFLQHVYNPKKLVKDSNLETLIHLSRYFDSQSIIKKCMKFIKDDSKCSDVRKLQLSTQFESDQLLKHLVSKVSDYHDLEDLYNQDGFDELDDSVVAAITRSLLSRFKVVKT